MPYIVQEEQGERHCISFCSSSCLLLDFVQLSPTVTVTKAVPHAHTRTTCGGEGCSGRTRCGTWPRPQQPQSGACP